MNARELMNILLEGDNLDRDVKFVVHKDTIRDLHNLTEKEDEKAPDGILMHDGEEFHFAVKEVNTEDYSEVMLSVD